MSERPIKNDKGYSPFHKELSEKYPIDDMLSQVNQHIITGGNIHPMQWMDIFKELPVEQTNRNSSAVIVSRFVSAAVRAGEWVDVKPRPKDEYNPRNPRRGKLDYDLAISNLKTVGFIKTVFDDDGSEWLSPAEELVKWIDKRFTDYNFKS